MTRSLVHPLHTLDVEGTTILAYPIHKYGYRTIKFDTRNAPRIGYRRARRVFGYLSVHLVVKGGRITPELVSVFMARGRRVLMGTAGSV